MARELRPYQLQAISQIKAAWQRGLYAVLFQAPTGTGKTVTFCEIVRQAVAEGKRCLIVAHRVELINQTVAHLKENGIAAGVIMADHPAAPQQMVQVASIQTLARRPPPPADLVVIDECHHAIADSYARLWKKYPKALFLGVTATPIRLSGQGFADLFEVLIPSPQIKWFIAEGYLVPIKYFVGVSPNVERVKVQMGDYSLKQLGQAIKTAPSIIGNLVASYKKHAWGKSMILFGVDVAHSKDIAARYNAHGIPAAHIDATTPARERQMILQQFKAKEIWVLCNAEIVTEGVDIPSCEVIQLARPTKSLVLALQMIGRVTRPFEGKKYGIVLDHAGLWQEHGLPTMDREWALQGATKLKPAAMALQSPEIEEGELLEISPKTRRELIESLDAELMEVTPELETLLEFERFVKKMQFHKHKVLKAYFDYKEFLAQRNQPFTRPILDYLIQRLNQINLTVPFERQFKPGFWHRVQREQAIKPTPQAAEGLRKQAGELLSQANGLRKQAHAGGDAAWFAKRINALEQNAKELYKQADGVTN